jgi:hypothetical protein
MLHSCHISFSQASYTVGESDGEATITLTRTFADGDVSNEFNAAPDTATSADFTPVTGQTVTWLNTDPNVKTVKVSITPDSLVEGDETIHLSLTNFQGTFPGAITEATLTIVDDDSNSPPSIANFGGAISYTENAAATTISTGIQIADSDSTNFATGKLTATIKSNANANDRLAITNQGTGAGQIGVSGSDVTFAGTKIGSFSGGAGSTPLVVALNAAATPARTQALARALTFKTLGDAPSTTARTLSLTLTDGDGGTSNTVTKTVTVAALNDAPVLNNALAPKLGNENEDASNPPGTVVNTLIVNAVTDPDPGALKGIAVTSAPTTSGAWEFSLDSGSTWTAVGNVSFSAALLIPAAGKLRFLPNLNFNGSLTLTYRAWDQTQGTKGKPFDLTGQIGGTHAFSAAVESAIQTVMPVNDAPFLNNSGSPTLTAIFEDSTSPAATAVQHLVDGIVTDVDRNAARGIAVVGAASTFGAWQFTLNGGTTWQAMGSVSASTARLLSADADTKIRFVPKANFHGTVTIVYRAWDRTQGADGQMFTTSGNLGGTRSLSKAAEGATLTVKPVNDAPAISGIGGSVNYTHDAGSFVLASTATVSDVDSADFGGGRLRVRIANTVDASNRLLIGGAFSVDSSNHVFLDSSEIGTRTLNGQGTTDLIVTFNSGATASIVQQLVRAISFKTVGGSPGTRDVIFTVSDGDGGTSVEATRQVKVT